jgi:hypothetical protein
MAIVGVRVIGVPAFISEAGICGLVNVLPMVLRSMTALFTFPPNAVGGTVGIVADNRGSITGCIAGLFFPTVLKSTVLTPETTRILANRIETIKTLRSTFIISLLTLI